VAALLGTLLVAAACGGGEEGNQPTPAAGTPQATVVRLPIGKISFSARRDGNGEIYLLTSKGEVNISNNPAEDIESSLSADGQKIVFSSDREGVYHLYVVNVDGSGLQKVTDDAAGDLSPRWSPDGSQIAFSRTGSLYVMNSDGSDVREILAAESEATAPPCKAGAFFGGWSPDGKRLTFYAASATRGIGQICTIAPDGSDLTVVVSEPPAYHVEPSWSPDGKWIAFRSIRDDNHEIYIVKPNGESVTNLTNDPATDIEPAWSPDGKWIVFGSLRAGNSNFDLYMMKPDGSDLQRLTADPDKDSDPSWGP